MPARVEVLAHYDPVPESGCWIWRGKIGSDGYGRHRRGKPHRQFYEAHKGPIPEGLFVCHKCDTRLCVNPDHLFVGNARDNNADALRKGRYPTGQRHYAARLTDEAVRFIREQRGRVPQKELAERFGVRFQTISKIQLGQRWTNE